MHTILIVEDDPVSAEVLSTYLEAHGYETRTARTGPEALQMYKTARPDLMLVDVQLPYRNGFEVTHEIRKMPEGRDVPVVLMSAVYTSAERGKAYAAKGLRAQDFLVKPFDLDTMLTRVRELLS
ncbi:MAG: response regulator [Deltaproteobacteria bacterium]|nr:MAG: response regulator [Deltaproteobacteria bacterium]